MKFRTTILLVLAIAGSALMTSCTKSYTCQCSIVYTGGTAGLPDSSEQVYNITNTASGAKSACSGNSFTHTDAASGIVTTETCVLY